MEMTEIDSCHDISFSSGKIQILAFNLRPKILSLSLQITYSHLSSGISAMTLKGWILMFLDSFFSLGFDGL